jgi:hypothetical protein
MACQQSDIGYPVIVTRRVDGYELSIRELLVTVRARTVSEGWKLLIERRQEVMEWAVAAGLLDELPAPQPLPPLVGPAD